MQKRSNSIIIADTSCLILLSKIEELELLQALAEKIYITSTVLTEFGLPIPGWILVKDPSPSPFQSLLEKELDAGEISAILLALESPSSMLVIDDQKGRKVAERLNLRYLGTLGLLLNAKRGGIIPHLAPILDKIRKTNFRFSNQILEELQKAAGE